MNALSRLGLHELSRLAARGETPPSFGRRCVPAGWVAPRVQLTLARLNIEEQRIAQLAAQLDQVRRELTAVGLESQKLSDQLPEVEQVLRTTTDDAERKSHEYERIAIKRKLSAQARL